MAKDNTCPLCGADQAVGFYADETRCYLRCRQCLLIYTPSRFHLAGDEEKAHYDLHENDPADAGYRKFLSRLSTPLLARLPPAAEGLDFGAGPGPTLSLMFEEAGHPMVIYDTYYAPDPSALARSYDFITATEVVEHLSLPGPELQRLWQLLRPGGWLGLMTKLALGREAFGRWHYKNDPTHIVFFSRETFTWLGQRWQTPPEFIGNDVVLFRKPRP